MAVKINQGTATNIATDTVGTDEYQIVKLDVGAAGASSLFTGTLSQISKGTITALASGTITGGTLQNLVSGTVNALASGTVTGGTLGNLNFGTVDTFYRHPDAFATVVSTGTNTFGTIKAAVTGSVIYVTDIIISAGSATVVEIGDGTVGAANIIGSLSLAANGGMVCNFRTPVKTSSNSALVYKQSTAVSPLTITCLGYVD